MFWNTGSKSLYRIGLAVLLIGTIAASTLAITTPAQAHCDSDKGPVATAAHQALESDNIKIVMPYVKADAEAELTAAFNEARVVRKTSSTARQLADRYFIETTIRLHRAGEGAPYTGVTEDDTPQAILVADHAMESGSTVEVYKMLNQAIQKGVDEKYQTVIKARAEAKRLNTVAAHRERVEAELTFEKYIYELYTTVASTQPLTEGHAH